MIREGQIIGRNYRIICKLGAGGMGLVYKALDINLGREVAIKFLAPDQYQNEEVVKRFINEGRILATINHPAVVTVYASDFDENINSHFLVMEYIDGNSIEHYKTNYLSNKELLYKHFIDILDGIKACHIKGIIHRDLKPSNILVTKDEKIKIVDFGIAKTAHKHTKTGIAMGTPHYMSPEQCLGKKEITYKTDIYSIGIMLWQFIVGKMPFDANENATDPAIAIALMHLNEPPPIEHLSEANISDDLKKIIIKMLSKNPVERPEISDIIEQLKMEITIIKNRTSPNIQNGKIQNNYYNTNNSTISLAANENTISNISKLDSNTLIGKKFKIINKSEQNEYYEIYKALNLESSTECILHIYNPILSQINEFISSFIKETSLFSNLSDNKFLKIIDFGLDDNLKQAYYVLENFSSINLHKYNIDFLQKVPEKSKSIIKIILQILEGIKFCHINNLVHKKITPYGIFVSSNTHEVKINPPYFGLSLVNSKQELKKIFTQNLLELQYLSPEHFNNESINPRSDVYSLGTIFWELIFGIPPFTIIQGQKDETNSKKDIMQKHLEATLPINNVLSDISLVNLLQIIKQMLQKEPNLRPSIEEVYNQIKLIYQDFYITKDKDQQKTIINNNISLVKNDLKINLENEINESNNQTLKAEPSKTHTKEAKIFKTEPSKDTLEKKDFYTTSSYSKIKNFLYNYKAQLLLFFILALVVILVSNYSSEKIKIELNDINKSSETISGENLLNNISSSSIILSYNATETNNNNTINLDQAPNNVLQLSSKETNQSTNTSLQESSIVDICDTSSTTLISTPSYSYLDSHLKDVSSQNTLLTGSIDSSITRNQTNTFSSSISSSPKNLILQKATLSAVLETATEVYSIQNNKVVEIKNELLSELKNPKRNLLQSSYSKKIINLYNQLVNLEEKQQLEEVRNMIAKSILETLEKINSEKDLNKLASLIKNIFNDEEIITIEIENKRKSLLEEQKRSEIQQNINFIEKYKPGSQAEEINKAFEKLYKLNTTEDEINQIKDKLTNKIIKAIKDTPPTKYQIAEKILFEASKIKVIKDLQIWEELKNEIQKNKEKTLSEIAKATQTIQIINPSQDKITTSTIETMTDKNVKDTEISKIKEENTLIKTELEVDKQNQTQPPKNETGTTIKESALDNKIFEQNEIIIYPNSKPTLEEVIKYAKQNVKILLHPGEYKGSFTIEKNITITSYNNDPTSVRITNDNKFPVFILSNKATLQNITINYTGSSQIDAVQVLSGSPTIKGCIITSSASSSPPDWSAAIGIYGGSPNLRDNKIYGCRGMGIIVRNAKPIIQNNIVEKNGIYGVWYTDSSEGLFSNNTVTNNQKSGIGIKSRSNPVIKNNYISNNGENGIFIYSDGNGIIEDNKLESNGFNGIQVDLGGKAIMIDGNTISNNLRHGLHVNGKGSEAKVGANNSYISNKLGTEKSENGGKINKI